MIKRQTIVRWINEAYRYGTWIETYPEGFDKYEDLLRRIAKRLAKEKGVGSKK